MELWQGLPLACPWLALGLQDDSLSISGPTLPIDSPVAIAEPYCKFSGEGGYIIRVDHPSDIAVLRGDGPAMTLIMQFVDEGKEVTAMQWKGVGNKVYLEKNYASAIECYTQAVDTSSQEYRAFCQDVHRKRAFANPTAKFFTAAKDDALASCAEEAIDEKAYYCTGRATYELGDYAKSKEYFKNSLKLNPKISRYMKDLSRANPRIRE
ncbi:hypothetical protein BGZ57DRAFT_952688 [Hyaloscypha finlandica]|nr:hypothetical protein BGZ57DRAFT_952688 [Hyaloscypha finlandica]